MKVYMTLTGIATNLHITPTDPGNLSAASAASGIVNWDTSYFQSDVYHVTGATETLMGSGVAEATISSGGEVTATGAWTPSSVSGLVGGSVLRVRQFDTQSSWSADFYSGPLVATGISSTEWTFSYRGANDYDVSGNSWLIARRSDSSIDGITLTGTPTSVRVYVQYLTPAFSQTIRGTWSTSSSDLHGLGYKSGSNITRNKGESVATNPYNVIIARCQTLPLVQGASVSACQMVVACVEDNADADYYMRGHAYHATSPTSSPADVLINNAVDTTEFTVTTAQGRSVSASGLSVSIPAANYVMAEVGFQSQNSHTTYRAGGAALGGTGATDATVGGTGVAWLELTLDSGGTEYQESVSVAATVAASASRTTKKSLAATAAAAFRPRGGA